MLKKLIILEGEKDLQCDSIQDVVKNLIDENFYNLTEEEKKNKMEMLAIANCIGENKEIISEITNIEDININLDEKFIIKDEITYILSLLILNKVVMLERTDANELLKNIDKSGIENN